MRIDILKKIRKDESGATAIEYGLIAALVSVVAIGAWTTLGESQNAMFQTVSDEMNAAVDSGPGNNNAGGPGGGKAGGGLSSNGPGGGTLGGGLGGEEAGDGDGDGDEARDTGKKL
jgi:pilus assembly protein Flp/PilA